MEQKIIAIDIRALIGGNISGVEKYIYEILDALFKQDKVNTYILYINAYSDQSAILNRFTDQPNVIKIQTRIPNKIFNLSLMLLRRPKLDSIIKRKTRLQPQTVFIPDLRPAPVSSRAKKICTVHDIAFYRHPELYSLKSRLWYFLLNPRRELREAHKIISVSQFTRSDLLNIQ